MKEIHLTHLEMHNFKGIKRLVIKPTGIITNISGDNELGKTTVFDAASWLWTGKDSRGRTDFDIKPLTKSGEQIHKVETSAEGIYKVGQMEVTLKRIYREKWVKKRGSDTSEFIGHETLFEYNGVPCTQKEYNEKLEDICPSDVMRLISQPEFFCSILPWREQRELLFKLAGDHDWDARTAKDNEDFVGLLDKLTGKGLSEYKKQIIAKKKKIRDQLDVIPARIDEVHYNKPVEQNWQTVDADLKKLKNELEQIEDKLLSISRANEDVEKKKTELQSKFHEKQRELWALKYEKKRAATIAGRKYVETKDDLQTEINMAERGIKVALESKEYLEKQIKALENEIAELRQAYVEEDKQKVEWTADGDEFVCPLLKIRCKDYAQSRRENLTETFNKTKVAILQDITDKGKAKTAKLNKVREELVLTEGSLDKHQKLRDDIIKELESLEAPNIVKTDLWDDPEYKALEQEVEKLKAEAEAPVKMESNETLVNQKKETAEKIDVLLFLLATKDQINAANARIKDLEHDERLLSEELALLEREEFVMDEFTRAKVGLIETEVNKKFEITKFKMFDLQVNGQYVETCEATYKGVPYAGLNTAGKINVGLDICYTFADFSGIAAPIFIDNRESVTNVLTHSQVQLFNLIKTSDKELTITPGQ